MLVHPLGQAGDVPEVGGDALFRRGPGEHLPGLLGLLPGEFRGVVVPGVSGADGFQSGLVPLSDPSLDRFGGSLHELGGEFLARTHRQHDDRLGLESHELVRSALLVVLEDAQLVIGQLNRAHAPIITRNPIPIHPECAPRGGRPSPRRAELTAVYLVSYLLWVPFPPY